jgi:hypothetical protein
MKTLPSYRGNPDLFWGEIKKLRFHLDNMDPKGERPFLRLRRVFPTGSIDVLRVNGKIDYITTTGGVVLPYIFLIYDINADHFVAIPLTISKNDYTLGDIILLSNGFTVYDNYYVDDNKRENCPAIIDNFVTVACENIFASPANKWDDWHYHSYTYTGQTAAEESDETWRPAPKLFSLSTLYNHFSITSYTALKNHPIITRYIEQFKRAYYPNNTVLDLPLLDDSFTFLPIISKGGTIYNFRLPNQGEAIYNPSALTFYGRNNYTLADEKIISFAEKLSAGNSSLVKLPSSDVILVQFFWPWIPYLNETGHFHILQYNRGDMGSSLLPEVSSFYKWKLLYFDSLGARKDVDAYEDTANFSEVTNTVSIIPEENKTRCLCNNPSYKYYDGYLCGTGEFKEDRETNIEPYQASGIKYTPIGAIGNKKTAYIKNEWNASGSGPKVESDLLDEVTGNLPFLYLALLQEWDTWPGIFGICLYQNKNHHEQTVKETASSSLAISQKLMFGDDEIDSGSSIMNYIMANDFSDIYDGSWKLEFDDCDLCSTAHIDYTSLTMITGTNQGITADGSGMSFRWELEGIGTISGSTGKSIIYYAPGSITDCDSDTATIKMYCSKIVNCQIIETLAESITINVLSNYNNYNVGTKCIVTDWGTCTSSYFPNNPYPYREVHLQTQIYGERYALTCLGVETLSGSIGSGGSCIGYEGNSCPEVTAICLGMLYTKLGCNAPWDQWYDNRSVAEKAGLCCPSQLT